MEVSMSTKMIKIDVHSVHLGNDNHYERHYIRHMHTKINNKCTKISWHIKKATQCANVPQSLHVYTMLVRLLLLFSRKMSEFDNNFRFN